MTYAANSSVPGYLGPSLTPLLPIEGASLDVFVTALVSNITGIPIALVRPRWQPTPPIQPPITTDWVAAGITEQDGDTFSYQTRDQTTGAIVMIRQERLTLSCSFYGANAMLNASKLRDGLSVPQNLENLMLNGFAFQNCGQIMNMATLENNQWYPRREIMVYLSRVIAREYPVLTILSGSGTVTSDDVVSNYQTKVIPA